MVIISRKIKFHFLSEKRPPRANPRRSENPLFMRFISDYSMIVATLPEPTVLPPSRYQNGVLQKLNGYFSFILCGKIRVLRCVRVVLGDFVIMVLSLDILISFYHSHLFFVLHMQHIDWIGFKFFFIC